MSGRSQRVGGNGIACTSVPATCGIPQGSVLRPTLLTVFKNDLPESVESSLKLFADDTKLYRVVDRDADAAALQNDIDEAMNSSTP